MRQNLRSHVYRLYRGPVRWQKNWYGWHDPRNWYAIVLLALKYQLPPSKLMQGLVIWKKLKDLQRYLCTLPRSGTNYINCILASSSDIEEGGDGEYFYYNDWWVHKTFLAYPATLNKYMFVLNLPTQIDPHNNMYLASHFPLIDHPLVADLASMKIVFTVRNIFNQLRSWVKHDGFEISSIDPAFFEERYLYPAINYFNFWGDYIAAPDKKKNVDYIFLGYEELVSDPLKHITDIVRFWGMNLSEQSLVKAIELSSRQNMKLRIPAPQIKENHRISLEESVVKDMPEERAELILAALRKDLRHDFGYSY